MSRRQTLATLLLAAALLLPAAGVHAAAGAAPPHGQVYRRPRPMERRTTSMVQIRATVGVFGQGGGVRWD